MSPVGAMVRTQHARRKRSSNRKVKSFARYVQTFWAFWALQVFPEGASRDEEIQNYLYKSVILEQFCNLLIISVL